MAKQRVGVIYGGKSGEHEISLLSAAAIMAQLDPEQFTVVALGIDKTGRWWLNDKHAVLGAPGEPAKVRSERAEPFICTRDAAQYCDVLLPICHGPLYEDGVLQGELEATGIPYVGANVLGSAIAMDKAVSKALLRDAGLPVVPEIHLTYKRWQAEPQAVLAQAQAELGALTFVKPCNLGSSVGTAKATTQAELEAAIEAALQFDTHIIIEKAINAREIEVAALQDKAQVRVSCPGEIIFDKRHAFYSYAAKYTDNADLQLVIPAPINKQTEDEIQTLAEQAFNVLRCQGMARCDFFLCKDTGAVYCNELNTLPGFTAASMYPKLWEASGLSFTQLLTSLISTAQDNFARQQSLCRDYAAVSP